MSKVTTVLSFFSGNNPEVDTWTPSLSTSRYFGKIVIKKSFHVGIFMFSEE